MANGGQSVCSRHPRFDGNFVMDAARQEQLFSKFPQIFQERATSATESAMCWGLQVGDGWHPLIDALCTQLQRLTDEDGAPQIVATQVKEKFGSLRFHTRESDERQKAMIELAREISVRTCDVCGAPGTTVSTQRMVATRCTEHFE